MKGEIQVIFLDEKTGLCIQHNFSDYASAYSWAISENLKYYEIVVVLRPPTW